MAGLVSDRGVRLLVVDARSLSTAVGDEAGLVGTGLAFRVDFASEDPGSAEDAHPVLARDDVVDLELDEVVKLLLDGLLPLVPLSGESGLLVGLGQVRGRGGRRGDRRDRGRDSGKDFGQDVWLGEELCRGSDESVEGGQLELHGELKDGEWVDGPRRRSRADRGEESVDVFILSEEDGVGRLLPGVWKRRRARRRGGWGGVRGSC